MSVLVVRTVACFSGRSSDKGAANIHITKTAVCKAADKGIKTIRLETRPTDAMVGGSGAAGPAPNLRHQPPGPNPAPFYVKNVGVGIY